MQRQSFSAAPLVNFLGTRDLSARVYMVPQEQIAQFVPKLMPMTSKGPTEPMLVSGPDIGVMYGFDSLNKTSKYHTHQTPYLQPAVQRGMAMVQRIVPSDAEKAKITVFAVVKTGDFPIHERNSNGMG